MKMTVFTITEYSGFDNLEEVVAICDNHASAIQWLIKNKGLGENYTEYYSLYSAYMSLKNLYGKDWLKVLLEYKVFFFHLDGLDYEIEEKELFSEKPLDN